MAVPLAKLLLLLPALRLRFASGVTCPAGWRGIGEKCYWLSDGVHTFESCMKHVCGPAGGTLACLDEPNVDNIAINTFVDLKNVSDKKKAPAAWIGYHRSKSDGQWRWVNGCDSHLQIKWKGGKPSEDCGGELCASWGALGYVSDKSCRHGLQCLCEYPGTANKEYYDNVPAMREDTCYQQGCQPHTPSVDSWCRAWPFWEHPEWPVPTCQWQREAANGDETAMGPGLRECYKRARNNEFCGDYIAYAAGHCECSQKDGPDSGCTKRETDEIYEIFKIVGYSVHHVESGERCSVNINIDEVFFQKHNWDSRPLRGVWLLFGIPCLLFTLNVLMHIWNPDELFRATITPRFVQGQLLQNVMGDYGEVLKLDDPRNATVVNNTVQFGSACTLIYAVALLCGGLEQAFSWRHSILMFTWLVMALCAFSIAAVVICIHSYLSGPARGITGPWMHVMAISQFLIGISAVGVSVVYWDLARGSTIRGLCEAYYAWQWVGVFSLPLHCISGAALWRIRVRAGVEGGMASISLVAGSFGAGFGMWLAGIMCNLTEKNYGMGAAIGPCYTFSAISNLVSGVALVVVNKEVKEAGVIELVDDSELVTTIGQTTNGESTRRRAVCQKRFQQYGDVV